MGGIGDRIRFVDLEASYSCWVETGLQRWAWKLGGRPAGDHVVVYAKDCYGLDRDDDSGEEQKEQSQNVCQR